jgi:hypothetical protein
MKNIQKMLRRMTFLVLGCCVLMTFGGENARGVQIDKHCAFTDNSVLIEECKKACGGELSPDEPLLCAPGHSEITLCRCKK